MSTKINLMKSKGLFYLTSVSLLAAIVLGLVTPGIALAQPPSPNALTDSYIIVFKEDVKPQVEVPSVAKAYGLQTGFIYEHALKGMSAVVPPGRLAALQKDPRVAYVVADMERSISGQTIPTGIQRIFADSNSQIGINSADDYRVDVDVAVIDTGVDFQHPDLNVAGGVNCTTSVFFPTCISGGDDDHYHGTHVAGTIGALDNGDGVVGVAPGARLWAVKVLNKRGSGYSSWIVAGIDWVAANAATIEVANMSLGGSGFNQAEYNAIQGAVNKGVAFAVAAGNEDSDARNYSPGGFNNVLSVSALADFDGLPGGLGSPTCRTDQDDTLADFSNWGPEVDIAAPGVCILSTYPLEKGEYGTISGTSMASPHAAGALALLASANNPANAADVIDLYDQVITSGNFDWEDDSGDGIHEPLLDVSDADIFNPVLVAGSGGGGGNTAPSVSITSPENGASFDSGASIDFAGSATDAEDGNLTSSLAWTSSRDGSIDTGGSFSTKALTVGTHTITASVTDSGGLSGSDSVTIEVKESVEENKPPTADFSYSISGLIVAFTDKSIDSDGTIASWNWNFGDGATSTEQDPSHTYTAAGTYNVTLTVTDDDGATGSTSQSVIVSNLSPTTIKVTSLAGSSTSVKNLWYATVTITVSTTQQGAVVNGSWSIGGTGTCTTTSSGQCSIPSSNLNKKVSSTTFTVSSVFLSGYTYDPSGSITSITIYKPN